MKFDFEEVFRRSPAPKMILDSELRFVAANPAYLTMVGRDWAELEDQYVFEAFPETDDRVDSLKSIFEATLDGEPTTLTEMPFRLTCDGEVREEWWTIHHELLTDSATGKRFVIQFSENVTEQVKMKEMRNALMGELQHRVGNLFSIVLAIARQTGRATGTVPDFLAMFEDRLNSLIKVNQQLGGKVSSDTDTIRSVLDYQLAVHGANAQDRIEIDGPDYPLTMLQSQALSMAAYELATNSLKYGAIGREDSRVEVTWNQLPNGGCLFTWNETNLEITQRPEKSGYGTMLLTTIIPSQLGGSGVQEFGANEYSYSLEIGPIAAD